MFGNFGPQEAYTQFAVAFDSYPINENSARDMKYDSRTFGLGRQSGEEAFELSPKKYETSDDRHRERHTSRYVSVSGWPHCEDVRLIK